jgi:hypothetical protein
MTAAIVAGLGAGVALVEKHLLARVMAWMR